MSTIALIAIEAAITFTTVALIARHAGERGLAIWIPVAMIAANITTAKTVAVGEWTVTLGNVLFASTFLASDIITEKYGVKKARKAIWHGVAALVAFIAATQYALIYTPADTDIAHNAMRDLFTLSARMTAASIACLLLANLLDIWLFDKIAQRTGHKRLWLRNNVATVVSNGGENFLFAFLAFGGLMPATVVLEIAITTTVVEMLIAFADTPFLYLATRSKEHA